MPGGINPRCERGQFPEARPCDNLTLAKVAVTFYIVTFGWGIHSVADVPADSFSPLRSDGLPADRTCSLSKRPFKGKEAQPTFAGESEAVRDALIQQTQRLLAQTTAYPFSMLRLCSRSRRRLTEDSFWAASTPIARRRRVQCSTCSEPHARQARRCREDDARQVLYRSQQDRHRRRDGQRRPFQVTTRVDAQLMAILPQRIEAITQAPRTSTPAEESDAEVQ